MPPTNSSGRNLIPESPPSSVPIDPHARARLVDAYSPGARVLRARRLRGGLGARTQVLDIAEASGVRSKVVLRAYFERESLTPERARREFRTIQLAQSAGIPSARPLFLDAEGECLGTPAMLLSYLPGRSLYRPHDVRAWTRQLAAAMRAVHAVTPASHDLSWLPRYGRVEIAAELEDLRQAVEAHADDIAREALQALEASIDAVGWREPRLIHEDFWPGNTVWYRGRLTGVIDWPNAKVGEPWIDVSQCCLDALLVNGFEVSDALRDAYSELAGPFPDAGFIDVFQGLRALVYFEIWLIGYDDAGLKDVTPARSRERIHAFLRRALDAAKK